MSQDNPFWGAPRIHGELLKLGIEVSQATVSIDFFTVPTATFRVLYVFFILLNDRREVIHFNVTYSPSAFWTGQQIVEAFPWDSAPKYLVRDRDKKYGKEFENRVESIGIKQVLISAQSPWQNP